MNFVIKEIGKCVRVKMTDDKTVFGWLKSASTDLHVNHDIVIGEPFIFKKDRPVTLGESMFIDSKSITSVLVYDDSDK